MRSLLSNHELDAEPKHFLSDETLNTRMGAHVVYARVSETVSAHPTNWMRMLIFAYNWKLPAYS